MDGVLQTGETRGSAAERVYEGHISFHPLKNVLTLLPDNTLLLNDEEIDRGAKCYFLDLKERAMYHIKDGKRYRIKHMKKIGDNQTGRTYLFQPDGWKIAIPEYKKIKREPSRSGEVKREPAPEELNLNVIHLHPGQVSITLDLPEGTALHSTEKSDLQFDSPLVRIPKEVNSLVLVYYYQRNGIREGSNHHLVCIREKVPEYTRPDPGSQQDRPIFGKSLLTMYYANESVYHRIPNLKELLEVKVPHRFSVNRDKDQLKISYHEGIRPNQFETLVMFQAERPVALLSFSQKETVLIPITYLDTSDQVKVEILVVELVPIYDREITVKLSVDSDQIDNGLIDIREQLLAEVEWLNPIELFPINQEDGFEITSEKFLIKLAPEERVYGEIVQRRILALTGSGEGQRILNLLICLPKRNSIQIIRYAQREQRIPVPSGEEIQFYNAITGVPLDPVKHDIEVFRKNELIEWINIGSDYGARSVSFELIIMNGETGLRETYIYNLLLLN